MDKLLNYLKIQIAIKKLTKEEELKKFPQYVGKI